MMHSLLFSLSLLAAGAASSNAAGNAGTGHMRHCPTAVDGATTTIVNGPSAVEITVTAKDSKAAAEIRARAKHLVEASQTNPNQVEHDGSGHGGGGLGRCEVVLKDTTIAAADVEGGSKITVTPKKPIDLEWLKKETAERQQENAGKAKK